MSSSLLQSDFFPATTAWVKRKLWNINAALLAAAFTSLLGGLFIQPNAYLLFAGLVLLLVLGWFWPWWNLVGLQAELHWVQPRGLIGEALEAQLQIHVRRYWPAWGLQVVTQSREVLFAVPGVAGGRRSTIRWFVTRHRRGLYPDAPIYLATSFPFGLRRVQRQILVPQPICIHPEERTVLSAVWGEGLPGETGVASQRTGSHGEMIGVRPYRRGDSPRRIHWQLTARYDRMIVCEFQATHRPEIHLHLVAASFPANASPLWENAVEAAYSSVANWLRLGLPVALQVGDFASTCQSGERHRWELLDHIAALPFDPQQLTVSSTGQHAIPTGYGRMIAFVGPLAEPGPYQVRFENLADTSEPDGSTNADAKTLNNWDRQLELLAQEPHLA